MAPKSFTFRFTVPRDPQLAAIVTDVANHAVGYAEIEAAAGADFVARVGVAAGQALARTSPDALQIIVASTATALTFEFDADIVSVTHTA
ncbi:MAG: hypothetical protein Q8N52_11470 [Acidobacteriota bacterium]|nr:hypothetical protein [Acidobacteriota bacterium]